MSTQADTVERYFIKNGFLGSPLTRRHIISLLIRGFGINDIYGIGCDIYCGAYG